ncbi:hypothetical protein SKAU_G00040840 [Synaphobranchus kaupii]|uniref:Uncharacterized protein n=1 Tax=Synaphobranchus kaupii TaxID=118154 RepID=A0A9Q1G153_SYNKA|nr:hypothetical protein SKAU_G00040840 [Synaphobranchus kaupii]
MQYWLSSALFPQHFPRRPSTGDAPHNISETRRRSGACYSSSPVLTCASPAQSVSACMTLASASGASRNGHASPEGPVLKAFRAVTERNDVPCTPSSNFAFLPGRFAIGVAADRGGDGDLGSARVLSTRLVGRVQRPVQGNAGCTYGSWTQNLPLEALRLKGVQGDFLSYPNLQPPQSLTHSQAPPTCLGTGWEWVGD